MTRRLLLAAGLVLAASAAWGQTSPGTAPVGSAAAQTPAVVAQPYTAEEFPSWLLKLRRAETIAVGAFPVAYLLVGLSYDYGYYATSGFPQGNVPWPLGPGTSKWTATAQGDQLQQKNWTLVGLSAGVSLLIAGADWLLGEK